MILFNSKRMGVGEDFPTLRRFLLHSRSEPHSKSQCSVLVGWDSWLRPLVFSIRRKPSVSILHFQMVSLDEFEAGEGSEIVHPAPQGNLMPQARGGTSTDVIWARIQQVLRGGASRHLGSWNCEAIARFVVTGEALSQPIGDRDGQMVA
jgi:hypothetical protein